MDGNARPLGDVAVLLCSGAEVDPGALPGYPFAVVDDLCTRPGAAAAALRATGCDRVVLGLCDEHPSRRLAGALRGAGADPFGIESVALRGRTDPARLLRAAIARLRALRAGDPGRTRFTNGGVSRGALLSLRGAVSVDRIAVLDRQLCTGCDICVGVCPRHAIGSDLEIDEGRCDACGLCVPACPVGAMRLSGLSLAQVEAQLAELVPGVPGVVFGTADEAVPEGWALVETPSPELATPGWILSVRARGAAVRAPASVIDFCDRLPADVGAPSTLREPRATVETLSSVAGDLLLEHSASPLGLLELDGALCTLCGACAIACPTRALTFDDTTLRLDPTACTACGLCVGVCPEDALAVKRGIDTARLRAGVVDLAHSDTESCSRCGADLPPLPMRKRLRTLLPQLAETPDDLCTGCAMSGAPAPSS